MRLVRISKVGGWGGREPLYQEVLRPHPIDVDRKELSDAGEIGRVENLGILVLLGPVPGDLGSFGMGTDPCPDEGRDTLLPNTLEEDLPAGVVESFSHPHVPLLSRSP